MLAPTPENPPETQSALERFKNDLRNKLISLMSRLTTLLSAAGHHDKIATPLAAFTDTANQLIKPIQNNTDVIIFMCESYFHFGHGLEDVSTKSLFDTIIELCIEYIYKNVSLAEFEEAITQVNADQDSTLDTILNIIKESLSNLPKYNATLAIINRYLTEQIKDENKKTESIIFTSIDALTLKIHAKAENITQNKLSIGESKPEDFPLDPHYQYPTLNDNYLIGQLYSYLQWIGPRHGLSKIDWELINTVLDRTLELIDPQKYPRHQHTDVITEVNIPVDQVMPGTGSFELHRRSIYMRIIAMAHTHPVSKLSINLGHADDMIAPILFALIPNNISALTIKCNISTTEELRYFIVCLREYLSRNNPLIAIEMNRAIISDQNESEPLHTELEDEQLYLKYLAKSLRNNYQIKSITSNFTDSGIFEIYLFHNYLYVNSKNALEAARSILATNNKAEEASTIVAANSKSATASTIIAEQSKLKEVTTYLETALSYEMHRNVLLHPNPAPSLLPEISLVISETYRNIFNRFILESATESEVAVTRKLFIQTLSIYTDAIMVLSNFDFIALSRFTECFQIDGDSSEIIMKSLLTIPSTHSFYIPALYIMATFYANLAPLSDATAEQDRLPTAIVYYSEVRQFQKEWCDQREIDSLYTALMNKTGHDSFENLKTNCPEDALRALNKVLKVAMRLDLPLKNIRLQILEQIALCKEKNAQFELANCLSISTEDANQLWADVSNIFNTTIINQLEVCDFNLDRSGMEQVLKDAKKMGVSFSAPNSQGLTALSAIIDSKQFFPAEAILDYINIEILFNCREFSEMLRKYIEMKYDAVCCPILIKFIEKANCIRNENFCLDSSYIDLLFDALIKESNTAYSVLSKLLQKGFNPNPQHGEKSLILTALALHRWQAIVCFLNFSTVKVELPDKIDGVPLLQYLANEFQREIIESLVNKYGADINIIDVSNIRKPRPEELDQYILFRDFIDSMRQKDIRALKSENAKLKSEIADLQYVNGRQKERLAETQQELSIPRPTETSQPIPTSSLSGAR